MKQRSSSPARPQQQFGVVLIVALVMLVIIGLASAAIMRNALSSDTVSDNNRRQAHALQAAQAALRYCEGLVQKGAGSATAAATEISAEDWNTFSNWLKAAATDGAPKTVPAAFMTPGGTNGNTPTKLPQCMAQARNVGAGQTIYVITARGFSENYNADTITGRTQTGAVVWLQSIIQLGS